MERFARRLWEWGLARAGKPRLVLDAIWRWTAQYQREIEMGTAISQKEGATYAATVDAASAGIKCWCIISISFFRSMGFVM